MKQEHINWFASQRYPTTEAKIAMKWDVPVHIAMSRIHTGTEEGILTTTRRNGLKIILPTRKLYKMEDQ